MGSKAVIRQQEMPQEMLDFLVAKTIVAQEQFNSEKEVASFLKKEMQDVYQSTWHVVIGRLWQCGKFCPGMADWFGFAKFQHFYLQRRGLHMDEICICLA